MSRYGSASVILTIGVLFVGMGSLGFLTGLPTFLVGNTEVQVQETGTTTAGRMIGEHLSQSYTDDAMNWSIFQTSNVFGATTRSPIKKWGEGGIPGPEEMESAFEERAADDFRRWYLGREPVREGCEIRTPEFNYTILERYRNTETEGHNFSVKSKGPIPVVCEKETGITKIYRSPRLRNVSHHTRLFYFYNITQNLTHNPGFRFRVEGAAMNVSKLLQIETDVTDQNCDAPDGDGTNSQDPPYNDGPDCQTDESAFNSPETELADAIDNAENKYEAQVRSKLQQYVEEYAQENYDDPGDWISPNWEAEGFEQVTINVEVAELEYKIEGLEGTDGNPDVYRDRYVSACTESHPDDVAGDGSYIHVTCDSSDRVAEGSCSCDFEGQNCADCCTSCDEDCTGSCSDADWASGNPNIDLSCSPSLGCTTGESSTNPSCSCSGVDDCSCPSYFPLHENPPFSVNDGENEEGYGVDCPGEKTATGGLERSCELDDACNVDPDKFDPDGGSAPHSGEDAIRWGDEHGEFVQCTNQDEFFSGTDNPWYITTSDSYTDGVDGPGEPGWSQSGFTARTFPVTTTTTGPTVRDIAGPSTAPVQEVRRGFIHTGPCIPGYNCPDDGDGDSDSGGDGSDGDGGDGDTCTASCSISDTCDYENTCYCSVTSSEETRYDSAQENEIVQTTAEYRFDLKAYVRLKITITDDRYTIPTADGLQPLQFTVMYDQYAIATPDEDGTDAISMCEMGTTAIDPDTRHTVP